MEWPPIAAGRVWAILARGCRATPASAAFAAASRAALFWAGVRVSESAYGGTGQLFAAQVVHPKCMAAFRSTSSSALHSAR